MTGFSKHGKKCTGTCRNSCEPLAIGDSGYLLTFAQLKGCKGLRDKVGEKLSHFVLMKEFEGNAPPVYVTLLSVLLYFYFSSSVAYSFSRNTNFSFASALSWFTIGALTPLFVQSIVALVLSLFQGTKLALVLLPVPSPVPTLLPSYVPHSPIRNRKRASLTSIASLIAGLLTALYLLQSFSEMEVIVKFVKPQRVEAIPVIASLMTSTPNPVALGVFAYIISIPFQLVTYPFSPGWFVFGELPLSWLAFAIPLATAIKDQLMATITFGYAVSVFLSPIAVKPFQYLVDPYERPSRIAIFLGVTLFVLTAPVVLK